MSAAALLAIVVATSEAHEPATAIMVAVATESLGSQVSVRLLPASRPEEVDATAIERDLAANAVVTLVWTDSARLHARLRLHVAGSERTTTRELVFDAADSRSERGRTLGLAAASMWPEIARLARAATPPRGPPDAAAPPNTKDVPRLVAAGPATAPAAPASIPAGERVVARPTSTATPTSTSLASRPADVARGGERIDRRPFPVPRLRIGIGAVAVAGLDGTDVGLGGRIEALLRLGAAWSVRMGIGLHRATIEALPGHDYATTLAGGVEWWPAALSFARVAAFGLRTDALLLRHDVRAAVIAGQPEQRVRYLPAADLLAQLMVRLSPRLELLAAGGAEAAVGRTDLRSGSTPVTVATIPAFRFAAEVGLRVGF